MRALLFTLLLALAACGPNAQPPQPPAPNLPPPASEAPPLRPTDFWLGRWTGVEGNFIDIAADGDRYAITIQELDGQGTYDGVADGEAIRFTRRGAEERLVAGNGAATGLKYLADKENCLVVREGEGFCR